jgi:type I restriction enzyme S subunit
MRVKLKDIGKIVTGKTPSKREESFWDKEDIPFVKPDDFKNDITLAKKYNTYMSSDASQKANLIPANSILVTCIGTIGKVLINNIEVATNQQINSIIPNDDIDIKYLMYQIHTKKSYLNHIANAPVVPIINKTTFGNVEINLHPLEEQKNIAQKLDKAQELIELRKSSIKKLDELSKALFVDMFGDPVENEMGWEVVELNTACDEIVDCINRTAPLSDEPTPYKMIRTTNVKNYKIIFNETRYVKEDIYKKWIRRLKPKKGDIVFTREAPMGEAGIITTNEDLFLGQRTMLFRPNNKLNSYYLLYELMGTNIYRQISKMSSGSTVKHLSVPKCKKFKINLPPLPLQQKFAKTIEKIEAQKALYEEELKGFENLFESLLSDSFA